MNTTTIPIRGNSIPSYTHNAAKDSAVLDMANSRQIALRVRLRNHFCSTECKPMGTVTVDLILKKMKLIDPRDVLSPGERAEILSSHYGFEHTDAGLIIPELIADTTGVEPSVSISNTSPKIPHTDAAVFNADVTTVGIEQTLKEGMSFRGSWSKIQHAVIGTPWPLEGGWKRRYISAGFRVPLAVHIEFVALRKLAPKMTAQCIFRKSAPVSKGKQGRT